MEQKKPSQMEHNSRPEPLNLESIKRKRRDSLGFSPFELEEMSRKSLLFKQSKPSKPITKKQPTVSKKCLKVQPKYELIKPSHPNETLMNQEGNFHKDDKIKMIGSNYPEMKPDSQVLNYSLSISSKIRDSQAVAMAESYNPRPLQAEMQMQSLNLAQHNLNAEANAEDLEVAAGTDKFLNENDELRSESKVIYEAITPVPTPVNIVESPKILPQFQYQESGDNKKSYTLGYQDGPENFLRVKCETQTNTDEPRQLFQPQFEAGYNQSNYVVTISDEETQHDQNPPHWTIQHRLVYHKRDPDESRSALEQSVQNADWRRAQDIYNQTHQAPAIEEQNANIGHVTQHHSGQHHVQQQQYSGHNQAPHSLQYSPQQKISKKTVHVRPQEPKINIASPQWQNRYVRQGEEIAIGANNLHNAVFSRNYPSTHLSEPVPTFQRRFIPFASSSLPCPPDYLDYWNHNPPRYMPVQIIQRSVPFQGHIEETYNGHHPYATHPLPGLHSTHHSTPLAIPHTNPHPGSHAFVNIHSTNPNPELHNVSISPNADLQLAQFERSELYGRSQPSAERRALHNFQFQPVQPPTDHNFGQAQPKPILNQFSMMPFMRRQSEHPPNDRPDV